jgi:hypothetical protein
MRTVPEWSHDALNSSAVCTNVDRIHESIVLAIPKPNLVLRTVSNSGTKLLHQCFFFPLY